LPWSSATWSVSGGTDARSEGGRPVGRAAVPSTCGQGVLVAAAPPGGDRPRGRGVAAQRATRRPSVDRRRDGRNLTCAHYPAIRVNPTWQIFPAAGHRLIGAEPGRGTARRPTPHHPRHRRRPTRSTHGRRGHRRIARSCRRQYRWEYPPTAERDAIPCGPNAIQCAVLARTGMLTSALRARGHTDLPLRAFVVDTTACPPLRAGLPLCRGVLQKTCGCRPWTHRVCGWPASAGG
jgi:hypothetical protein